VLILWLNSQNQEFAKAAMTTMVE